MTNKHYIHYIILSLLLAATGLLMMLLESTGNTGELLLNAGLGVGQILGMLLLLQNGNIQGTVYFRIIRFCMGLILLGAMFKIMHWPGANLILLLSMFGVAITYGIWFLRKKQKGRLDFLKLVWVLSAFIGTVLVILHWVKPGITYIAYGFFWLSLVDFVATGLKTKTLFAR